MAVTKAEALHFTGNAEADELLARDPMALLIGFALDQQVSVQKAFSAPLELVRRVGTIDAEALAGMEPAKLEQAFRNKPALHRYPGTMARRTQELAAAIVSDTAATRPASGQRPRTVPSSSGACSTCPGSDR